MSDPGGDVTAGDEPDEDERRTLALRRIRRRVVLVSAALAEDAGHRGATLRALALGDAAPVGLTSPFSGRLVLHLT